MRYENMQFGDNEDIMFEDRPAAVDLNAQITLDQMLQALGEGETYGGSMPDDETTGGESDDDEMFEGEGEDGYAEVDDAEPLGAYSVDSGNPFADEGPAPSYDSEGLDASQRILRELTAPSLNTIGRGDYPQAGGDTFSGDMLTRLRRLVRKL